MSHASELFLVARLKGSCKGGVEIEGKFLRMQRSCFHVKWSFLKLGAKVSFNYWEHTVNKKATQLAWVQDTSPPLPGVGILASIKLLISFQKHFCQLKKSFNTYPSGHEILSGEHLNWWDKIEPIPTRTELPPKPPEARTRQAAPQTRGGIHQLHLFLWATLPSGSEGLHIIPGPNWCSKKLEGFNKKSSRKMHFRTRFKDAFWDEISLPYDTVTYYLRELNVQTGSQTEDIIYPPVIPNNTMCIV